MWAGWYAFRPTYTAFLAVFLVVPFLVEPFTCSFTLLRVFSHPSNSVAALPSSPPSVDFSPSPTGSFDGVVSSGSYNTAFHAFVLVVRFLPP